MCTTCGCDAEQSVKVLFPGEQEHVHHQHNDHNGHHHHYDEHHHSTHGGNQELLLEKDVLLKNDLMAARNRGYLEAKNIMAINLVSSPGSGKTTLLEKSIKHLVNDFPVYVIEGDQQTTNDAERIEATGVKAVQVNTGKGCHLDADMVQQAIKKLAPEDRSLLFVENVGNLVCPSMFDLGEQYRVVIISVTEGEDKPLKYPTMFETADICIINKTDLLPYVEFDVEKVKEYALRVNHHLVFFEVSATKEKGLEPWINWLKAKMLVF